MIPVLDYEDLGTLIYWVGLALMWAFGFASGHSR